MIRSSLLSVLTATINKLVLIGAFLAKVLLVFIVAILCYEVVLRYLFNSPTGFADELSGYFLAGMVVLGAPHVLRIDGHVRVEILFKRLPGKFQKWFHYVLNLLAVPPLIILIWFLLELIINYYISNRLSFASILQVPLWIPISIAPIGLFMLVLTIIGEVLNLLDNRRS